jgi:23S rRNA pseudouridine955/2504/2580 synthase
MREIVLGAKETPKKLENFLKKEFPIGYIRKLFRKNGVRVNGRRARENDVVKADDRIQLYIPFEAAKKAPRGSTSSAARLETIYEDDALLVIDKPAGIAVHEGKTVHKRESILGILEERYRGSAISPYLVHRLDKDTSGILVIAKNRRAGEEMEKIFESGEAGKEYLCLTVGRIPSNEGKIDFLLPGRQGSPVRALTRFQVLQRFSETTLVRVRIETGRLHQIRLHFAELGHPVVLDDQHGDFAFNKRFRKEYGLKRQFLHAEKLQLNYGGKQREWNAPLGRDLERVLKSLQSPAG